MTITTLFARTISGQVKTWSCWIEADGITVASTWGIKDGKMQTTRDTMKANSRRSAREMAQEEYARQMERKRRAGYVAAEATIQTARLPLGKGLDFDHLPRSFAPGKPIQEIDLSLAQAWSRRGLLAIQRKRDGMRHYLVSGNDPNGQVRVFSRGMDDMTAHFARLVQELSLPPGTVLDAEFVVTAKDGTDDFVAVSEICRSKPDRAARTMVEKERTGRMVEFLVFDMLFYNRLPTWQLPYGERYPAMTQSVEMAHDANRTTAFNHVRSMPMQSCSLNAAIERVHQYGWEGLILWRKDQATQVHLNRSPKRCNCYKFKPMLEGDFVATGFELGKGRNQKVVGALTLATVIGVGPLRYRSMGNVGTGFSDQQRREALRWTYPCVVQIKYEKMSETGLRFPAFLRLRPDKKLKECV